MNREPDGIGRGCVLGQERLKQHCGFNDNVSLELSTITGNGDYSNNHWSCWQGWKMSKGGQVE